MDISSGNGLELKHSGWVSSENSVAEKTKNSLRARVTIAEGGPRFNEQTRILSVDRTVDNAIEVVFIFIKNYKHT